MPSRTPRPARPVRIAVCSAGAAAMAVAVCAYTLPQRMELPGGLVLLQVTPAGEFGPNDGRADAGPWRIDAASARELIERFEARRAAGMPAPVIDYEHQTLHREKNGQPAPAAGWIRELRWIEGQGLYAVAELTERARAQVQAGEYRYFSPVFAYDEDTGTVLAVHMGAFTNTPAINGMEPLSLVAAATAAFLPTRQTPSHPQETSVNPLLKAVLAALGLPETTDEKAALAALTALGPLAPLQARANVATAACSALQLPEDASAEAVTAAAAALRAAPAGTPDPAKFVPVGVLAEVQQQLAALTAQVNDDKAGAAIEAAKQDGRLITAEQEAHARSVAQSGGLAALNAFLSVLTPIAALTATQTGGQPPAGTGSQLSAAELAVAQACGLSAEAFATGRV